MSSIERPGLWGIDDPISLVLSSIKYDGWKYEEEA